MTSYVIRDGRLVEKHLAPPKHSARPAAYVISDTMPSLKHPGTGRHHDSKAAFRADTRACGGTEVGTDPAISRPGPKPEPRGIEMDVKRAIAQLRSR